MEGDEVGATGGAQGAQDAGSESGTQATQVSGGAAAPPAGARSATDGEGAGTAVGAAGFEAAIAERDARIGELEAQVAEATRSAEAADALREQIEQLKEQAEAERVDFALASAGARSVKAARALLDEHGGDIAELKGAEPWLFADEPPRAQTGRTGLPNAGVATDEGAQMKRWRALAGLSEGA